MSSLARRSGEGRRDEMILKKNERYKFYIALTVVNTDTIDYGGRNADGICAFVFVSLISYTRDVRPTCEISFSVLLSIVIFF